MSAYLSCEFRRKEFPEDVPEVSGNYTEWKMLMRDSYRETLGPVRNGDHAIVLDLIPCIVEEEDIVTCTPWIYYGMGWESNGLDDERLFLVKLREGGFKTLLLDENSHEQIKQCLRSSHTH